MSLFTNILNPFITVRNQVKDKTGRWKDLQQPHEVLKRRSESRITAKDTQVKIFSIWDRPIVIESLMIGGTRNAYPLLWTRREEVGLTLTNMFVTNTKDGGRSNSWAGVLYTHGDTDLLKLEKWEDDTRESKIILKRPIYLPEGAELRLGTGELDGESSYQVFWREIRS